MKDREPGLSGTGPCHISLDALQIDARCLTTASILKKVTENKCLSKPNFSQKLNFTLCRAVVFGAHILLFMPRGGIWRVGSDLGIAGVDILAWGPFCDNW